MKPAILLVCSIYFVPGMSVNRIFHLLGFCGERGDPFFSLR